MNEALFTEENPPMTAHLQPSTHIDSVEVSFTLSALGISDQLKSEALEKAKEAYVMTLSAAGEITSGKSSSLLDIFRLEMIKCMRQQGIPLFDDSMDIESLHQEVNQTNNSINTSHLLKKWNQD
ncbi:MAG: UPF0175 family protein [Cyanobacteria bacterium P01_F01_bin.53]